MKAMRVSVVSVVLALGLLGSACTSPSAPSAPTQAPAKPAAAAPTPASVATPTAAAAAPAAPTQAVAKKTVAVAYSSKNATYADIYVGQQKGFFADEALTVEESLSGGSAKGMQNLLSNATNLVGTSADMVMSANEAGGDAVIVAATTAKQVYYLNVGKGVSTWDDLRGKVIGVASLTGTEPSQLKSLLSRHGLTFGKDYNLQVVGSTPEKIAALQNGAVAAATVYPPQTFQIEGEGFKILGTTGELDRWPSAIWAARKSWIQQNEDTMVRLLRGIYRSHQWLADPANRGQAIDIISSTAKIDKLYMDAQYEEFWGKGAQYTKDASPNMDGVAYVMEVAIADGTVKSTGKKAQDYADLSYLQKAIAGVKK